MHKRNRTRSLVSLGLAAVVALAGAAVFLTADNPVRADDLSDSRATVRALSDTFADVTERVSPAVVYITVEKEVGNRPASFEGMPDALRRFFGPGFEFGIPDDPGNGQRRRMPIGQGSGFIVSPDGYIVTNHHVVGDADKVSVHLKDRREFTATIVGSDPLTEIALIKVDANDLPYLRFGDSDSVRVGEWVLAIGNPFGLSHTVTSGIVSASGRSNIMTPGGEDFYANFIQTDAAINPGNSGGPLLNMNGEVIGMNTMIFSQSGGSNGIGFAVPINMVKYISDQLREHGKVTRGFLGVGIQNLTADLAKWFGDGNLQGVLVSEVTPDSPGERAGLQRDDLIVEFDGQPVTDAAAFRTRVSMTPSGKTTKIVVVRNGERIEKDITIGEKEGTIVARAENGSEPGTGKLGLQLENLTGDLASRLGIENETGVVVAGVQPGSPADMARIRPGQLITEVNRKPVRNTSEFRDALKDTKDGTTLLRVKDGDLSHYVTIETA